MNTDRTKQQPAIIIILIVIIITPNSPNDFGKQSGRIIVVGSLGPRPERRRDPFAQYQSASAVVVWRPTIGQSSSTSGEKCSSVEIPIPNRKVEANREDSTSEAKKERILRSEESSECEKKEEKLSPVSVIKGEKEELCRRAVIAAAAGSYHTQARAR